MRASSSDVDSCTTTILSCEEYFNAFSTILITAILTSSRSPRISALPSLTTTIRLASILVASFLMVSKTSLKSNILRAANGFVRVSSRSLANTLSINSDIRLIVRRIRKTLVSTWLPPETRRFCVAAEITARGFLSSCDINAIKFLLLGAKVIEGHNEKTHVRDAGCYRSGKVAPRQNLMLYRVKHADRLN